MKKKLWIVAGAIGAIILGFLAYCVSNSNALTENATVPFHGIHQAGIETPTQKFAYFAVFDLTTKNPSDVRGLLQSWTRASEALSQGKEVGDNQDRSVPPGDTGETLQYLPARLTITVGVGPSLFDERFGIAAQKPDALVALPPFAGDSLNPQWTGGDIAVQVCSDDFQTSYHAIHILTRLAKGTAVVQWVQAGFKAGPEVNPHEVGRNLQGFKDGMKNPDPSSAKDMDAIVWVGVGEGPEWMHGGSYLVVRKIRMFVETWDRSSLGDQENTIGRHKLSGDEQSAMADNSHVKLARGDGTEKILRRPFSYVNGLDSVTGQWDSGLLFLGWQKDPRKQFVPIQQRLSGSDALNEYIQTVGSGVFAMFPGVAVGDYFGSKLFPEIPLAQRLEKLQAVLGGLYPALGKSDWGVIRAGAAEWKQRWFEGKTPVGDHAAEIENAFADWNAALSAAAPDRTSVQQGMTRLVKLLSSWHDSILAIERPQGHQTLSVLIGQVDKAQSATSPQEMQNYFAAFQNEWLAGESIVRSLDSKVYGDIEMQIGLTRVALNAEPPTPESARTSLREIHTALTSLGAAPAFSAWDVGFLFFREGLEALLVIAALLAFLGKTGQSSRSPWVWGGAGAGLFASVGVAFLVSGIMGSLTSGSPQELVEGLTGLMAVALMLTVGAWLHGKAAIRDWNKWLKEKMGTSSNSLVSLALLAFVAVLREGSETVIFFWSISGSLGVTAILAGIGGAIVVLAIIGIAMIRLSRRLPLQWFFPLATVLVYYLSVKILGQSLAALQTAGILPIHPLAGWPTLQWIGMSPTLETLVPQVLLAAILLFFVSKPFFAKKTTKS